MALESEKSEVRGCNKYLLNILVEIFRSKKNKHKGDKGDEAKAAINGSEEQGTSSEAGVNFSIQVWSLIKFFFSFFLYTCLLINLVIGS